MNEGYDFCGGALALDLVNTERIRRGETRDLLSTPDDLVGWWHEALAHHPQHRGIGGSDALPEDRGDLPAALVALKAMRKALREIFSALAEGRRVEEADLEVLNGVLSTGYRSLCHGPRGELAPRHLTRDEERGWLLLPVAVSAFDLITQGDTERLRECRNPRCRALFHDTSKSATRVWCTTACMSRARSARRYRQAKARTAGLSSPS